MESDIFSLPAYSVLMSVYAKDHPDWLLQALESMAQQTLPPLEIILVFDGPVPSNLYDAIDEFESRHPNLLKRVELKKNVGLGSALNAGIPHCLGEIIVRMDADDISHSNRCLIQLSTMVARNLDMIGCNVSEFSQNPNEPRALRVLPESANEIERFAHGRSPFAHPAFCVRKSALEEINGYRNVRFAEDYDLFIRLLASGHRGENIQKPLVSMRVDKKAYQRRGGISYLHDMLAFNVLHLKEGWFSPRDFIIRSAANCVAALVPNSIRDALYRHVLRNAS